MNNRDAKLWLRYSSVGLELAVAVFIFTGGGYWLDTKTEMLPLFTLSGAIFGMVVGFYQVYRSLDRDEKIEKSDKDRNGIEKD